MDKIDRLHDHRFCDLGVIVSITENQEKYAKNYFHINISQ